MNSRHFKGLAWWQKLTNTPPDDCAVLYLGTESYLTAHGRMVPWGEWA